MPLHLFRKTPRYDFMGKRWIGFALSIFLTLGSFGLLFTKGLNLGIDFTGGVLVELRTEQPADLAAMRAALTDDTLGEVSLQNFGQANEVIIRVQMKGEQEQSVIVASIKEKLAKAAPGKIDYRKIDYVGPTIGDELVMNGTLACALAMLAIMAYIWIRFEWQYGVGGILSLIHDSILIIGFFSLTGLEFGLTAIAAVLTIVGYSINDSVVIYDRIRENMRKYKKMPIEQLLNVSINETLSRTILTASTTLLASLALALYGGAVLEGFAWAIVFGVIAGTYSSIYISAPTLIYLHLRDAEEAAAQAA